MLAKADDTPPESPNPSLDMDDDDVEFIELNEDDLEEVADDSLVAVEEEIDSGDEGSGIEDVVHSNPIRDDSDFVFSKHQGSVFCCNLDPKNGSLAVTGAEDDKAYVWEIQGGQILFECTGHKDSVMAAEFSHDGTYVATADMSGTIKVWRMATQTLAWSESVEDISWLRWHHGTNVLFCATVRGGDVYMWKIPSGECKMLPGHAVTTDCGAIMPDGRRATICYADGSIKLYDLKTGSIQASVPVGDAHSGAISAIDVHRDNNLIITGGEDGKVTLIKTQPLKVIARFNTDESPSDVSEWVEAVGFCNDPTLPLAAAGTLTGKIYIWDIAKQTLRHKCEQESGISRLVWYGKGPLLYAGSLDGAIRIYDARSGTLQSQLLGHRDNILDISISDDGNTLLSAGDDNTARVFAINTPDR